jgi:hypothetical protein
MDQNALTRGEPAMFEERLPRGQSGESDGSGVHEIERSRLEGEIARANGDQLGFTAVAVVVGEAEDGGARPQPSRVNAQSLDDP